MRKAQADTKRPMVRLSPRGAGILDRFASSLEAQDRAQGGDRRITRKDAIEMLLDLYNRGGLAPTEDVNTACAAFVDMCYRFFFLLCEAGGVNDGKDHVQGTYDAGTGQLFLCLANRDDVCHEFEVPERIKDHVGRIFASQGSKQIVHRGSLAIQEALTASEKVVL